MLTLHRADRVGERIYHVRKQELRGFDSIFQSSRVMAAVVREARRMAPLDAPLLIEGETGTGRSCWRAPATWPARAGSRRSWR